jgi:hypothetical protein
VADLDDRARIHVFGAARIGFTASAFAKRDF